MGGLEGLEHSHSEYHSDDIILKNHNFACAEKAAFRVINWDHSSSLPTPRKVPSSSMRHAEISAKSPSWFAKWTPFLGVSGCLHWHVLLIAWAKQQAKDGTYKQWGSKEHEKNNKTLQNTIAFMLTAFPIAIICLPWLSFSYGWLWRVNETSGEKPPFKRHVGPLANRGSVLLSENWPSSKKKAFRSFRPQKPPQRKTKGSERNRGHSVRTPAASNAWVDRRARLSRNKKRLSILNSLCTCSFKNLRTMLGSQQRQRVSFFQVSINTYFLKLSVYSSIYPSSYMYNWMEYSIER